MFSATVEQQELVAKISAVHEKLRKSRKKVEVEGRDEEEWKCIWKEHTLDETTLKVY